MSERIPLSEILTEIRNELIALDAEATKPGSSPIMKFEECEVEFQVSIEKKADVGVKIYVVNLGGDVKEVNSNKVKIKFKALPGRTLQAEARAAHDIGPPIDRSQRIAPQE